MKKLILLLLFVTAAYLTQAQVTEVTGKITDQNKSPLQNASVKEKGTKNGTFANDQGVFSIKVKPGARLVISAVGFEEKEISASDNLNVSLTTEARNLSEVVVTGTGVATSKKKIGISVESISADKLPQTPTASIDQALVGKIPGAQISSVDGTPGAKTNILLRDINTIQGGQNP